MKNKGRKQFSSGLAPMHSVAEPNGADASAMPLVQEGDADAAVKTEKKKTVALGYRVLSAILLLLALGGLFLGMLFAIFPSLEAFSAFHALGDSAFDATLLGLFVEVFKNISLYAESVGGKLFLAVLFFFAVCLLVSIVCSLIAFFAGKQAKVCTYVNVSALFLGYVTLFAYNFANVNAVYSSLDLGFAKEMFDLPTALIAGISFIILLVLVFLDKSERNARTGDKCLNILMYLLMLGVLFAFFYPGTATAGYMTAIGADLFHTAKGTLFGVSVLLVAALFAFNFLASAIRLHFKKGYAFDTVRFGLQICAVAFFLIMARDSAIFSQKLPAVIVMLVVAFLLFFIPFLVSVLSNVHKKDVKDGQFAEEAKTIALDEPVTETEEEAEEETEPLALPAPSEDALLLARQPELELNAKTIFGTAEPDPKDQYIDEFVAQMIESEKEETTMLDTTEEFDDTLDDDLEDETLDEPMPEPPAPAPQPQSTQPQPQPAPAYEQYAPYTTYEPYTPVPAEEDKEEIIVFTADNFDPNNPLLFATSGGEPSTVIGAGTSFIAGMPPVRERIVEKVVEVEKKQPKVELTEFEKQMAEQAKEPAPVTESAFDVPSYAGNQPIIQQTFIANPAQASAPTSVATASAPTPVPPPAPALSGMPDFEKIERERRERERERYDSQYAYDPFISTLTPDERNEFGDVFISYRHGVQNYLPAYVIGGDNRKFFRLLFAQLGRYREYISVNLMDKMYSFVSSGKH